MNDDQFIGQGRGGSHDPKFNREVLKAVLIAVGPTFLIVVLACVAAIMLGMR